MILFIPLIGIMRVGFSQVHELKPYGYLLGNIIDYNKYEEIDRQEHEKIEESESEPKSEPEEVVVQ